jgi:4-carboxymuconolactone decarboxylase
MSPAAHDEGPDNGADRYARGEAVYDEVYGSARPQRGQSLYVDVMIEQLFAEVWSRDALPIRDRRLLVMGVLAAQGALDKVEMQLRRAVEIGELTVDQVDEVVLHLSHYIGWGLASPLAMVAASMRDAVGDGPAASDDGGNGR